MRRVTLGCVIYPLRGCASSTRLGVGRQTQPVPRLPAAKAFDMSAKWETADMLRADLETARAAWITEGPTGEDRAKRGG